LMLDIAVVLRSLPSPPSIGGVVSTVRQRPRHGSQAGDRDPANSGTPGTHHAWVIVGR
jgi:hypothetical protein